MGLGATWRRSGDLATRDSSPSQFPNRSASCIPRCAFSLGIPQPARSPCALDPTQAPGSATAGAKVTVYGQDRGAGEKGPVDPRSRRAGRLLGRGRPKLRWSGSPTPRPARLQCPRARAGTRRAAGAAGWRGRDSEFVCKVQAGQKPGRGPRPRGQPWL